MPLAPRHSKRADTCRAFTNALPTRFCLHPRLLVVDQSMMLCDSRPLVWNQSTDQSPEVVVAEELVNLSFYLGDSRPLAWKATIDQLESKSVSVTAHPLAILGKPTSSWPRWRRRTTSSSAPLPSRTTNSRTRWAKPPSRKKHFSSRLTACAPWSSPTTP